MKLIIDLPEEDFGWNGILNICRCSFERLIQIVSEGTPLEEQEPCDDCIHREDALMALTGEWTESRDEILSKAIRRIRVLSPVKPTEKVGQWIPVSEGEYPEAYTEVLVYDNSDYFIAWWTGIRGRWDSYNSQFDINTPIVAWMPIEPYKASPTGSEPKVGQWIEHKTDDGRSWLECPICHIKKQYPITNYCPKCGSRNTEKDIPDENGWVW